MLWKNAGSLAVVFMLAGLGARASVQQIPFEQLVATADAIVVGEVGSTTSKFTPDAQRIVTVVTIKVKETIRGSVGRRCEVHVGGGQVGETRMAEIDEPVTRVGEQALFFLSRDGDHYKITGRAQGKLTVRDDTVYQDGVSRGSVADIKARIRQTPKGVGL